MATGSAVESAPDAVEALNHLNEIATRYCESQMVFAGCSLGIFEELANGPASAEELAQRRGFHAEAGRRLLIALSGIGVLTRKGDRFANSGFAEYLAAGAGVPMFPLMPGWKQFYPMWGNLDDAVRECSPRWQQTFGATQADVFANVYKDPAALRGFCGLMSAYSIPQGQLLAHEVDFSRHECVLDVAGGAGGLIVGAGKRYPNLRGIVMDMPPVCEVADETFRAAGLAGRFVSRPADLFEGPYPEGADVITLGWILHDWNDDHCRQILRNCHAALPPGGTLIICESILNPDGSGSPFATLMSLHMLVVCEPGARERTEGEYAELLHSTGFEIERLVRPGAPRDFLIARKIS
jgi:hypothetical protein